MVACCTPATSHSSSPSSAFLRTWGCCWTRYAGGCLGRSPCNGLSVCWHRSIAAPTPARHAALARVDAVDAADRAACLTDFGGEATEFPLGEIWQPEHDAVAEAYYGTLAEAILETLRELPRTG